MWGPGGVSTGAAKKNDGPAVISKAASDEQWIGALGIRAPVYQYNFNANWSSRASFGLFRVE